MKTKSSPRKARDEIAALRRRLADRERFVEMVVGRAGAGSILYTRDGLGRIWRWDHTRQCWLELSPKRLPVSQQAAPAHPAASA